MVGSGAGLDVGVEVGGGVGSGDGVGVMFSDVGIAVGAAVVLASGVGVGDGNCSAAAGVICDGGVWWAGSDSTGPQVPPRASSMSPAQAARSHRTRMTREPLVLAVGQP